MRRIDSQIFNTPTGRTYDPSESIARSANRTSQQVYGIMERESQRQKAEEDAFNLIYSNLGEIEGKLQQDYAGAFQEMVDATKFMAADHFKSGGRVNDPEFVKKYTEMTSRIRAGMGNADRIIKQLDQQAKSIAENPYMDYDGKRKAIQEILGMAQNRDVLISKNPIDFMGIEQKYVNPNLVFKDAYLSLPSMGEFETTFESPEGDLMSRIMAKNDLIPEDKPFDEQGRPNINLDVPRAMEIMKENPMLTQMVDRIRKQNYANEPYDLGMARALRDGFMSVAPMTQKTRVKQTAGERAKEAANLRRANTLADLNIAKASRELKKMDMDEATTKKLQENWGQFQNSWDSNTPSFMKNYESATIKDIGFGGARESFRNESPENAQKIESALSSIENWKSMNRDDRVAIMEFLGESPSWRTDTDTKEVYDKMVSSFNSQYPDVRGITYKTKGGTTQGVTNWEDQFIPINDINDLEGAFLMFENRRGVGKVTPKVDTETEQPQFRSVPKGGFN